LSMLFATTLAHAGFFDGLRMLAGGSVQFVLPADSPQLTTYRTIATAAKSPGAQALQGSAEQILTDAKVGGAPLFKQVLRLDPGMSVGEPFAILELTSDQPAIDERSFTEMRTQCLNKKAVCKDEQARHYQVNCRSRVASVRGALVISDGLKHSQLTSRNASLQTTSQVCEGDSGSLEDAASLSGRATAQLAQKLVGEFLPKTQKRPLDLVESDPAADASTNANLKQAYRLASSGELPASLRLYPSVVNGGYSSGVVLFDTAFCLQAMGKFAAAKDAYAQAATATKPPSDIGKFKPEVDDWVARGVSSVVPE